MVGSDIGEVHRRIVVVRGFGAIVVLGLAVKTLTWSGPLKSPSTHLVKENSQLAPAARTVPTLQSASPASVPYTVSARLVMVTGSSLRGVLAPRR